MDEEAPNVFTVSVGNIPPKARVIIKIIFVMELVMEGDLLLFRLPGAVAPDVRDQSQDTFTQVSFSAHRAAPGPMEPPLPFLLSSPPILIRPAPALIGFSFIVTGLSRRNIRL